MIIHILVHVCELNLIGSSIEVFTDGSNTFMGLLFPDSFMKSVFGLYPEVILVNLNYKLNMTADYGYKVTIFIQNCIR